MHQPRLLNLTRAADAAHYAAAERGNTLVKVEIKDGKILRVTRPLAQPVEYLTPERGVVRELQAGLAVSSFGGLLDYCVAIRRPTAFAKPANGKSVLFYRNDTGPAPCLLPLFIPPHITLELIDHDHGPAVEASEIRNLKSEISHPPSELSSAVHRRFGRRKTSSTGPWVMEVPVISTGHVSRADADLLEHGENSHAITQDEFSVILIIEDENNFPECSPAFNTLLTAFRDLGYGHLRLDVDGEEVDGLPTYDW